jgi:hypothetical protein
MMLISINSNFDRQGRSGCSTDYSFLQLEQEFSLSYHGSADFAGAGFVAFNSNGGGFAAALDRAEGNTVAGALVLASSG